MRPARPLPTRKVSPQVDMDIEMAFADIDADVSFRSRDLLGQFRTLHTGRSPYHLFRTRTERRSNQAPPRRIIAKGRDGPLRPSLDGGHHPGATHGAPSTAVNATCKGRGEDGVEEVADL